MLVQHFDIAEFCASDTAVRLRIENELPPDLEPNAWATLAMLEKIRSHLSKKAGKDVPITILSGYRCPDLNRAVRGVPTSDHVKGMAADIRAPAFGSPVEIAKELAAHVDDLGIGQLINEFPGASGWCHVSTRKPDKLVNRIITITAAGPVVGVMQA